MLSQQPSLGRDVYTFHLHISSESFAGLQVTDMQEKNLCFGAC